MSPERFVKGESERTPMIQHPLRANWLENL
jgi:hypothetical protein